MNGLQVAFVAFVAGDPELRFTASGSRVLSFSAGVFDAKAAPTDPKEWVRVSVWNELADEMEQRVKKGAEIYAEGRLKPSIYTAKNGEVRTALNVSAWTLTVMGQIGKKRPPASTANSTGKPSPASRRSPRRRGRTEV